jgi:hypothetical protein
MDTDDLEPLSETDPQDSAIVAAGGELADFMHALRIKYRLSLAGVFAVLAGELVGWADIAIQLERNRRPVEEATPKRRGTL